MVHITTSPYRRQWESEWNIDLLLLNLLLLVYMFSLLNADILRNAVSPQSYEMKGFIGVVRTD